MAIFSENPASHHPPIQTSSFWPQNSILINFDKKTPKNALDPTLVVVGAEIACFLGNPANHLSRQKVSGRKT